MLLLLPIHDTGRVKRHRERCRVASTPGEEVVALLGVEVEVVEHEVEHPHDRPLGDRGRLTRPGPVGGDDERQHVVVDGLRLGDRGERRRGLA